MPAARKDIVTVEPLVVDEPTAIHILGNKPRMLQILQDEGLLEPITRGHKLLTFDLAELRRAWAVFVAKSRDGGCDY